MPSAVAFAGVDGDDLAAGDEAAVDVLVRAVVVPAVLLTSVRRASR